MKVRSENGNTLTHPPATSLPALKPGD